MDINFDKILDNYEKQVSSSSLINNLGHITKQDFICSSFINYICYRMKDIYKQLFSTEEVNKNVEDLYNRIK